MRIIIFLIVIGSVSSLDLACTAPKKQSLEKSGKEVLKELAKSDFVGIAKFIHPTKGILISPYTYIHPNENKRFSKEEYLSLVHTNEIIHWGTQDGTGDPFV